MRLGAPLLAFFLTVAPSVSPVHAVEDARKVSVVSFGLFGDQGVFRSESTGAAQVVAGRFGSGPITVQYNSKKGGGATIETLAMSLQVAANGMDAENDVLFLILTSLLPILIAASFFITCANSRTPLLNLLRQSALIERAALSGRRRRLLNLASTSLSGCRPGPGMSARPHARYRRRFVAFDKRASVDRC